MAFTEIMMALGILGLFALFGAILVQLTRGRQRDARLADEARLVARDRASSLEQTIAQLVGAQNEIKGQVSTLSEVHVNAQARTLKVLEERFDGITGKMNVSLSDSAEKTAKSLGEITNRLNVIDEAQKNITELSGQVVGLQHILDNKQARGAFGEIQMEDIFRNALPPSAYAFQSTLSNGKRADGVILLPNPPGPIVVDSKFPLEPYRALRDASDDAALAQAKRDFKQAVKKHIKDISEKYIIIGETAESALMFLPSEAVYAELHANFVDLIEESYRARVWIVSPTTLMATLNTVRAVLKDVAMREQAHLIQVQVGKMMGDVERLHKRVGNLQRHFSQAEGDLKEITTSADKVMRHGEKIEEVQLAVDEKSDGETGLANELSDPAIKSTPADAEQISVVDQGLDPKTPAAH